MKYQVILVTSRSFVIEHLSDGYYNTEEYDIYLNDIKILTSNKMVQTVYDLKVDTEYKIQLQRGDDVSEVISIRTKSEYVTLDVRDFGAKGDGVTDDTKAIQAAIMCCPKDSRVYIASGVYKFTNLFLKSDLIFEISKDAVLLGIPDPKLYPILPGRVESYDEQDEYLIASWEGNPIDSYASLITGMYVENVLICGEGTIDGGSDFDSWWDQEKRRKNPAVRPKMLFLNHCKNVTLQGITVKNSPSWNLHPYFSQTIKFIDIRLESPSKSHNTDGIDPESCTDVEIVGVYFSVGDDCIAIKSGKIYMGKKYKTPSKDIIIRHCYMKKGHGAVTIGSEIGAGVDNIVVKNCFFDDTDRGLRIKTRRGRGEDSVLHNIIFEDIKMDHVRTPFVVNSFYYCGPDGKTEYVASKEPLEVDERTPSVKTLIFKNIKCSNSHVAGAYFYGLPEKKIERIIMENIHITYAKEAKAGTAAMMTGCNVTSKQGIYIRNVNHLSLKNVVVEGNSGEVFDMEGVDEIVRE